MHSDDDMPNFPYNFGIGAERRRLSYESRRRGGTGCAQAAWQDYGVCCMVVMAGTVFVLFSLLVAFSDNDHYGNCDTSSSRFSRDHSRYKDVYLHNTHKPMARLIDPHHASSYGQPHDQRPQHSPQHDDWSVHAPDPADVSDLIYDSQNEEYWPGERDPSDRSAMFWLWGQFIDHTLVRTDTDPHETLYTGRGRLPGHRSRYVYDSYGVRQQVNSLSPFLDGSNLYGSDERTQALLRKQPRYDASRHSRRSTKGKMRYSVNPDHVGYDDHQSAHDPSWYYNYGYGKDRSLLPYNRTTGHYMAGDVRAEEHVALTAMHTLWMREHNYWCERLHREHPDWDDDKLYLYARNIVAGEMQAITYNEWLPLLLGSKDLYGRRACYKRQSYDNVHGYGEGFVEEEQQQPQAAEELHEPAPRASDPRSSVRQQEAFGGSDDDEPYADPRTHYDDEDAYAPADKRFHYVNSYRSDSAQLFNEFATAAFRFGHTMVNDRIDYRNPNAGHLEYSLPLSDLFFQRSPVPHGHIWKDNVDGWLLGACKQRANHISPRMVDALRRHLFRNVTPSETMDLAARNIARGRDHALPSYQRLYNWATGGYMTSCHHMSDSPRLCQHIEQLYGLHGEIDAWVGMTCEKKRRYSMLGVVGSELVAEQFDRVRNNDPYFYLWNDLVLHYRAEIHSTTMAKVLMRNTIINPHHVQKDAFLVSGTYADYYESEWYAQQDQ